MRNSYKSNILTFQSKVSLFCCRCAGNKELLETGLEWAAMFANNIMLDILIQHKKGPIATDLLHKMMKRAIESDCNETVKIVKTQFTEGRHDVPQDVLDVAKERRIYSILSTLGILTMTEEEINKRKEEIRQNIKNGTASVSRNDELRF